MIDRRMQRMVLIVIVLLTALPAFGQNSLLGFINLGDKPVQFADSSGQLADSGVALRTDRFLTINPDDFDPLPILFRSDPTSGWQPLLDDAGQKIIIDPGKKNTLQLFVVNQKNDISLEILDNPVSAGARILIVNGTAKKLDGFSLTKTPQGEPVVPAAGLDAKSHSPLLNCAPGDWFIFYSQAGDPQKLFLRKENKWPPQPGTFAFAKSRYFLIEVNGQDAHISIRDVTDDPAL
jgi:hypothetical protein